MGWFDDAVGAAKKVGGGVADAVDKTTDILIDKDAWSNTAQAMLDGPGGKTVKGEDIVNMLLDSTMAIPGVGLVGGGARVGARLAAKKIGQETAEAAAKKATAATLRSPLNNKVRGAVADKAGVLTAKVLPGGARGTASNSARKAAKDPLETQFGRIAAKQKAGVGRKVGFGQTKKRIAGNALLAGGANALTRGYDTLFDKPEGKGDEGDSFSVGDMMKPGGSGPGGGFYLVGADGSQQAVPDAFMKALADFMEQNGTVDGEQVVYSK